MRIFLAVCVVSAVCLNAETLSAQRGGKKPRPAKAPAPPLPDLDDVWAAGDRQIRLMLVGAKLKGLFYRVPGQCETGGSREKFIEGEVSPPERSGGTDSNPVYRYRIQGDIWLCTNPELYRDCRGKGLNPETEVWKTTFEGSFESRPEDLELRHVRVIELKYTGQYYEKETMDGQVTRCRKTGDPENQIGLYRGVNVGFDGEGDTGRDFDPGSRPPPPPTPTPTPKDRIRDARDGLDKVEESFWEALWDPFDMR